MLVQVAKVVDATQRKPEEYHYQSFFGEYDLWLYVVEDYTKRLCETCEKHARTQVFRGTELRGTFPYLEIRDEDMIYAGVHPRCRCFLFRIIGIRQYFELLEKLERREKK